MREAGLSGSSRSAHVLVLTDVSDRTGWPLSELDLANECRHPHDEWPPRPEIRGDLKKNNGIEPGNLRLRRVEDGDRSGEREDGRRRGRCRKGDGKAAYDALTKMKNFDSWVTPPPFFLGDRRYGRTK